MTHDSLTIVMHEEGRLVGFIVVDDDGSGVGVDGVLYFLGESALTTFDDGDPRSRWYRLVGNTLDQVYNSYTFIWVDLGWSGGGTESAAETNNRFR